MQMIPGATGCNETVRVYHLPPYASLAISYLFECKSKVRIERKYASSSHNRNTRRIQKRNFNTFLTIYVLNIYIYIYV